MNARSLKNYLALAVVACACASDRPTPPPSAEGTDHPIVLVTLSALRPDYVHALGGPAIWTPHLDAIAQEAEWVGTTVVASSAPAVSLMSLMTGVSPWQHQVLSHDPATPRAGISLLAEALNQAGYRTAARVPLVYELYRYGIFQGFEDIAEVDPVDETASSLDRLDGPGFLWFHLREANFDLHRRDAQLPRLAARSSDLPPRLESRRLLPYADPELAMPAELQSMAKELFGHEVAWADQQIGAIASALRTSGHWNRAWFVVTASQGMEMGEHAQALYAQNLGRETIEVPLVIKAPEGWSGAFTDARRVSQKRLWSTLVEAAGEQADLLREPSLFRDADAPILSELYQRNGVNEFSLLDGDLQLIWRTRFADPEPEFYLAQYSLRGGQVPLSESSRQIFGRLGDAFRRTRPLSGPTGGPPPELRLERWTETGVEPQAQPERATAMAIELRRRWLRYVDRERTPGQESTLSQPPE